MDPVAALNALAHAVSGTEWDGVAVNVALSDLAEGFDRADEDRRAEVMPDLARFVRTGPIEVAGIVAMLGGATVERGSPPDDLFDALLTRVPAVLASARRFAEAIAARFPDGGPDDAPDDGPLQVGSVNVSDDLARELAAIDGESVGAWHGLDRWCMPMIASGTTSRARLERLVTDGVLRAATEPLHDLDPSVGFLWALLELPLNERWVVIHRPTMRGFEVDVDGVAVNFELHTLLAAALAPALGFAGPPDEVVACLSGQGEQGRTTHSTGFFETLGWRGAADPPGHDVPLAHRVWNEGRPHDVPLFEGRRVVVLDPPIIQRTWNTVRTFRAVGGSVRVARELPADDVRGWVERMVAAR